MSEYKPVQRNSAPTITSEICSDVWKSGIDDSRIALNTSLEDKQIAPGSYMVVQNQVDQHENFWLKWTANN